MRLKISGEIIQNNNIEKTNYSHEIYCMLLNNINQETAKEWHIQRKFIKPFTFSNLYIKEKDVHFYFGSTDEIAMELANNLSINNIIKIADKVIVIKKIICLDELKEKEEYLFKVKATCNIKNAEGKTMLPEDIEVFKQMLINNAIRKYIQIYKEEPAEGIDIKILNSKRVCIKYKKGNVKGYNCIIKATGNYKLISLLYNIGLGQKCSSGFGLMWEV